MYIMSFCLSVVPYKLDLDRLNEENGYFYQPYQAYHHSKLLNVLFTRELSKRLKGITKMTKQNDFYVKAMIEKLELG